MQSAELDLGSGFVIVFVYLQGKWNNISNM